MMNKHTQEEWKFNDNTLYWSNTPYSVTCRKPGVHSATIAAIRKGNSIPDEEKRANALLITAAPDLLHALTELLRVFPDIERDDETITAVVDARAAITKARGMYDTR